MPNIAYVNTVVSWRTLH